MIVGVFSWWRRGREGPTERGERTGVEKTRGEYSATTGNYSLLSLSFHHEERHRWHQRVRTFIRKFTNTRPTCTLLISHRCSFVRSSSTTTQQRAAAPTIEVASFAHVASHRPIPAAAQFHRFPSFSTTSFRFPSFHFGLVLLRSIPYPTSLHIEPSIVFVRVPCLCSCACYVYIREHRVLRELRPSPVEFKLTLTHTRVHTRTP